jgi:hypothetical protein
MLAMDFFKYCFMVALSFIALTARAQPAIVLTEVQANFVPLILGESRWADINGDGNLDLMICGQSRANNLRREFHTYLGGSTGAFTEVDSGLPPMSSGTFDLADIDGDVDLDVAISGTSNASFISSIYKNNGNGTFVASQQLDWSAFQSIHFGDYDADGDPDLLISASAIVLRNDGGVFQSISQLLFPFSTGTSNFIDIDMDGKLDVAQSGVPPVNELVTGLVWRQQSPGVFLPLAGNYRRMLDRSEIQVRDANCDGLPDMLFGEAFDGTTPGAVYRNTGQNSFTEEHFNRLSLSYNSSFIDLDGDTVPEVILTGSLRLGFPVGIATDVYRRVNNQYEYIPDLILPGFRSASINAVDFDHDGDEDLFMLGDYSSGPADEFSERAVLYRNDTPQVARCVRTSSQRLPVPSNRTSSILFAVLVLLTGFWSFKNR